MKKEKTIKTYQRRTKSGKLTTVKQHTAKYDAAEAAKEALKKAKGAGREFEKGSGGLTSRDYEEIELSQKELDKYAKALGVSPSDVGSWYAGGNWSKTTTKGANNTDKAVKRYLEKVYGQNEGDKAYKYYDQQARLAAALFSHIETGKVNSNKLGGINEYAPKKDLTKMNPVKSKEEKSQDKVNKVNAKEFGSTKGWEKKPAKTDTSSKATPTVSPEDYKAWYHWDPNSDPKNAGAIRAEKAMKAKMGTKEYNKYYDKIVDSYSSRGHLKSYKELEPAEHSKVKSSKMLEGTAKAQKEIAEKMGAKEAAAKFDKIAKEAKAKKDPSSVNWKVRIKKAAKVEGITEAEAAQKYLAEDKIAKGGKSTSTLMRGEKKGDTDSYFGTASLNEAYKKSLAAIKSGDPKQIRKAMSDYAGYHSHHGDHFEDKESKRYRGKQMISLKEKLGKLGLNAFGFKLGKEKGSVSESREKVRGKSTKPAPGKKKGIGPMGKSKEEKKGDKEREVSIYGRELTKEERKKYKTPRA